MNDNPDGTPNPLNPAPMEPVGPDIPAGPMGDEQPEPMQLSDAEQPMEPMQPMESEPMSPEPMEPEPSMESAPPVEPMGPEPMEPLSPEPVVPVEAVDTVVTETMVTEPEPKDSIVEPKNKSSKKPIIILAIVFLLVAIGCGIAAIVLLNPFAKKDPVPAAITKLISDPSTNVVISGTVSIDSESNDSYMKSLSVDFSSSLNAQTSENASNATISATLVDDSEYNIEAEEVYTKSGDLYLKFSGISDMIDNNTEEPVVDCVEGVDCVEPEINGETNCYKDENGISNCGDPYESLDPMSEVILFLTALDGSWIKVPSSILESILDTESSGLSAQCLSVFSGAPTDSSSIIESYNKNPFIEYSTENIPIAKKKYAVYRLTLNSEKMKTFASENTDSEYVRKVFSCLDSSSLTADNLPDTYVEIDDNDNISRVYLSATSKDGKTKGVADLSFTYPSTSVTIDEPTEFIDFSTLFLQLMGGIDNNAIIDNGPTY